MKVSSGGANPFTLNNVFTITNNTAWVEVGHELAEAKELQWGISGTASVTAHVLGLPMSFGGITLSKIVTVKGFGGLKDVDVKAFTMDQSTEDMVRVKVIASVWNPSYTMIAPVGELFFDMSYKGAHMGTLKTDGEVNMTRGWSPMTMSGDFKPGEDPRTKALTDELMSNYLLGVPNNVT